MILWIVVFFGWYASGHMGISHPGRQYDFWQGACEENKRKACMNLFQFTELECDKGNPLACAQLGVLYRNGKGVEPNQQEAYKAVNRSCSMGFQPACQRLKEFLP